MGLSKFHSPGSPLSATITSCSSDLFIVSGDLKKTGGEIEVGVARDEEQLYLYLYLVSWVLAKLILVTTATTRGGALFQAGACFSKEFWPVLATFRYFVTNLRTFWFPFYRPELCGGAPKLTNIRCGFYRHGLQGIL